MANIYFRSSVQLVFSPKRRAALIHPSFQTNLHRYLGGILLNNNHKPLAINSMPNHIHIFFGMYPCNLPQLVNDLKSDSSLWINKHNLSPYRFQWQDGYGFFTYSYRDRSDIIQYVENQQVHHNEISFKDEYLQTLKEMDVEFKDKYLFEFFE